MDKITCGGFEWVRNPAAKDNRIDGGTLFLANAIAQDELSVDTLDAEIWSLCRIPVAFAPADYDGLETADGRRFQSHSGLADVTEIPYGTPIDYYRDATLLARLYKSEMTRAGPAVYQLQGVSAIGLLGKLPHMGGLYTGQSAGAVLAEIIGGAFAYTVDTDVAATLVFGWLPSGTKRDNLRQLLFATGAAVRKSADGGIRFSFLTAKEPTEISGDRLYTGGGLSYDTPATGVDVTEHTYYTTPADTAVTLFDNTDGSGAVERKTIAFDQPCHDLAPSSDITIHESGVNYAILSGTGTLTGKAYTHQTKIVSRRLSAAAENIVAVKEATLVSVANSGSVADRVLAYYSGAKTLSVSIIAGEERPGDAVRLEDAFGDLTEGLVQSTSIRISATLKADTTIITGYTPTHHGNDYNNRVLLTGEGVWTVPDAATRVKCVLIAAGTGGAAGMDGESGRNSIFRYPGGTGTFSAEPGAYGAGGKGGEAGQGGKIFEIEIALTPGKKIAYHAHPGGAAGQEAGTPGTEGEDTVFGDHSSAAGECIPAGYADVMSGSIFGVKGVDGIDGGDGGTGGISGGTGGTGEGASSWTGGAGNKGRSIPSSRPVGTATIGGGAGGGAAYGSNGKDATGSITIGGMMGIIASGADGGDAQPHSANSDSSYGNGGAGGNGGGGGGGSGQIRMTVTSGSEPFSDTAYGGNGGARSVARDGSPGCIIVYY